MSVSPFRNINRDDQQLRQRFQAAVETNSEYWAFRNDAVRRHAHSLFQYPAMMVPQMQARLIDDICQVCPTIQNIYDPYVGSGTVLTEAMLRGLNFWGQDINPLAVLLCRVKAGPFFVDSLELRVQGLTSRMKSDRKRSIAVDFAGIQKWFRDDVARDLSKIVRAIREERELWSRRFFWVALAETIRRTSNSRTSTVKLHVRPPEEIATRSIDVVSLFQGIAVSNAARLRAKHAILRDRKRLVHGAYANNVEIRLGDSAKASTDHEASRFDLLITSPPYGDNVTTVPYGQHSYLPLQWIDRKDIDPKFDEQLISTTHAIDSSSLGGRRKGALETIPELKERSSAFVATMRGLQGEKRDRTLRVSAFIRDLDTSLAAILPQMRRNAYLLWVVGNRSVGQRTIPLDAIVRELHESRGAVHVTTIERTIPSKRMAVRNDTSSTMTKECILVMRKDGN
jgi:hypothetical protein